MNTPAPTPADLATRLLEHAAVHDAETSPYSPEQAQWAADLRAAATALSSPAPAQAAPVESVAGDQLDPENCDHWCPHCGGSGDVEVPDSAGPDAHMVPANCPHCHGNGTLYAAYRGVVKLQQQEHQKYSKLLAEWYFLKNQIPAQTAPSAVPEGYAVVPVEPTPEMVAAYLAANHTYWKEMDEGPAPIGKWRNGTPSEATAESYAAMLAAAPVPAAPVVAPPPKLIGWRTDDYLNETADPKVAKNWEVHYRMLPLFEGDPNTKLAAPKD